jgi:hypothetical protein
MAFGTNWLRPADIPVKREDHGICLQLRDRDEPGSVEQWPGEFLAMNNDGANVRAKKGSSQTLFSPLALISFLHVSTGFPAALAPPPTGKRPKHQDIQCLR